MSCTHCGSDAVYAGKCATCGQSQTNFLHAQSLKRVAEKRRTCKHTNERQMTSDYTGGLGFKVFRCTDCGRERREEVA